MDADPRADQETTEPVLSTRKPGPLRLAVLRDERHPDSAWVRLATGLRDRVAVVADVPVGHTEEPDRAALSALSDAAPEVVLVVTDAARTPAWCLAVAEELPAARPVAAPTDDVDEAETLAVALAGARGLLPCDTNDLDDPPSSLATILYRVCRGEVEMPSTMARVLLEHLVADPEAPAMTPTEREVLQRLAGGATVEEVAAMHQVPPRQVRLHAGFAMARLALRQDDQRARMSAGSQ